MQFPQTQVRSHADQTMLSSWASGAFQSRSDQGPGLVPCARDGLGPMVRGQPSYARQLSGTHRQSSAGAGANVPGHLNEDGVPSLLRSVEGPKPPSRSAWSCAESKDRVARGCLGCSS